MDDSKSRQAWNRRSNRSQTTIIITVSNGLGESLPLRPSLPSRPTPSAGTPAGTKNGVTRYEVWRLPALKNEAGFVSVALTADMDAKPDLMGQMDECIRDWQERLTNDRRPSWRRHRR